MLLLQHLAVCHNRFPCSCPNQSWALLNQDNRACYESENYFHTAFSADLVDDSAEMSSCSKQRETCNTSGRAADQSSCRYPSVIALGIFDSRVWAVSLVRYNSLFCWFFQDYFLLILRNPLPLSLLFSLYMLFPIWHLLKLLLAEQD